MQNRKTSLSRSPTGSCSASFLGLFFFFFLGSLSPHQGSYFSASVQSLHSRDCEFLPLDVGYFCLSLNILKLVPSEAKLFGSSSVLWGLPFKICVKEKSTVLPHWYFFPSNLCYYAYRHFHFWHFWTPRAQDFPTKKMTLCDTSLASHNLANF